MRSRLTTRSLLGFMILLASATAISFEETSARSFSAVNLKPFHFATQAQTRRRAPELTGGRGWLNTDQPLSLAALKGKIVLLDFWTYGCIAISRPEKR